ncbi:MAG: hypothetical protein Q7R95_01135, partial [bacterium]|nr:hypothetical protein [bacterium]
YGLEDLNSKGLFVNARTTYEFENGRVMNATIIFYNTREGKISSGCGAYPDVEVHEILHTFGFEHVSQKYHIMNPVQTYCPTKINEDVVKKLNRDYFLFKLQN